MANSILTIDMITREAIRLWKNSNAFIQNIDTQYDSSFAVSGAKIGAQLRIRLPNDYTVRQGAAASIQNTQEQYIPLVMATQSGVDVAFNSADLTLKLDDYSQRVLAPEINVLAGNVASNVMQGSEGGVCNLISNRDQVGNLQSPTLQTYLRAGSALKTNSAPTTRGQKIVNNQVTEANVVSSLAGLLNPQEAVSKQYMSGQMYSAVGFDWMFDQTIIVHTTGTATGVTVNGANQTGQTLAVNPLNNPINVGDIITLQGVFAVNRVTKATTGELRQFAVTANAPAGATSLSIYPAITPPVNGNTVQYQTVMMSPANGASVTLATPVGSQYYKNIAYIPEAITLATADLEIPPMVEAAREVFDGISMRMVVQYNVQSDQTIQRLDVLYGFLFIRPEWCCVICDPVPTFQ